MTFANLGNFKLQKWGFLLCNSVHFYFTTNIFSNFCTIIRYQTNWFNGSKRYN